MDLDAYRRQPREQERIRSLIEILPKGSKTLLEIGARDGYISKKLTEYFETVVALDLENPNVDHPSVVSVKGDVTALQFADNEFDCVFCSEVLEHISPLLIQRACNEIVRVAKNYIMVGVPYKQENRILRTTCSNCGGKNPPYGHVNVFSKQKLEKLFSGLHLERVDFVGQENNGRTNWISVKLMDFAGNPFGTYDQEEKCIFCNKKMNPPSPKRFLLRRVCSKSAHLLTNLQNMFKIKKFKPVWIHVVFSKQRQ